MKILITGAEGTLGGTLAAAFAGVETVLADMPDRDVADDEAFTARALSESPDLIVHCAEMGDVDECELDSTSAFELNENGARNAALAAKLCGARLIALSTGYVFSGEPPRQPWAWGEGDIPRPRTVYGMSKFAGEQMIQMIYPENSVILRTDWLSVSIQNHTYVSVRYSKLISKHLVRNSIDMHQTNQIACPFFGHLFSTPFIISS